jgi:hypothetical protein
MALQLLVWPWLICFSLLILYTIGETPWREINPLESLSLYTGQNTHTHTHTQNKSIRISNDIRTQELSGSCFTLRGHWDLLHQSNFQYFTLKYIPSVFLKVNAYSFDAT